MDGSPELLQGAPRRPSLCYHRRDSGMGGQEGTECYIISRLAGPALHLYFQLLVLDQVGHRLLPELGSWTGVGGNT